MMRYRDALQLEAFYEMKRWGEPHETIDFDRTLPTGFPWRGIAGGYYVRANRGVRNTRRLRTWHRAPYSNLSISLSLALTFLLHR